MPDATQARERAMTKIRLMSDIHIEFGELSVPRNSLLEPRMGNERARLRGTLSLSDLWRVCGGPEWQATTSAAKMADSLRVTWPAVFIAFEY
jgi:hypothetical protein